MENGICYVFLIVLFASCQQVNKDNGVIVKEGTSIDSFRRLVHFPYAIKSVHWFVETNENKSGRSIPGPTDWLLIAEIKCDSMEIYKIRNIINREENVISKKMFVHSRFRKEWFSPKLKDCFVKEGAYYIFKSTSYKINEHLFPHMSSKGYFAIIDDDGIYLSISSK